MIDDGDCGEVGGIEIGRRKPKYSEKTYPSATLSTANLTWADMGSNPGRRGGKPATNLLSYSVVYPIPSSGEKVGDTYSVVSDK
jgi:hypothetical protein